MLPQAFVSTASTFLLPLALLAGCGDKDSSSPAQTIVAEVSEEISTVVTVTWTTDSPTTGYVQYGPTEEMSQKTPLEAEATTEHSAVLMGLTSDTEHYFKVVTWDGDDATRSSMKTVSTEALPSAKKLPPLTVEGEGHDQYTIVPLISDTHTAVSILNSDGEYVWYYLDDSGLDVYRARLSLDGKSILYNAASVSGDPADNSELVRISLDGGERTPIALPLLAHDFVELPDGTLAVMVVEYRDFDDDGEVVELRGDKIVEVAKDGTEETVWSAWDCFDPATDQGTDAIAGWTFANALDYDPGEDVYYLGMRNFSSIVKIDRKSGACLWVLGTTAETISFADGTPPFAHQHQLQVSGDSIVVFDNEGSFGQESRVIEYSLDFEKNIATEVWSYKADPTVYTFVLGEPTRLDDGDTFVNWSAGGQMERVSAKGESKWQINSPLGFVFGFNTLEERLYRDPAPTESL